MTLTVAVNTLFEFVGALLAGRSAWLAARTRPAGVSLAMMAWSCLWAAQCVGYYLGHGETLSAVFAGWRCLFLGTWCAVAITGRKEQ